MQNITIRLSADAYGSAEEIEVVVPAETLGDALATLGEVLTKLCATSSVGVATTKKCASCGHAWTDDTVWCKRCNARAEPCPSDGMVECPWCKGWGHFNSRGERSGNPTDPVCRTCHGERFVPRTKEASLVQARWDGEDMKVSVNGEAWCLDCGPGLCTCKDAQRSNEALVTDVDPATNEKLEPGTVYIRCSCGNVAYHDLVSRPETALIPKEMSAVIEAAEVLAERIWSDERCDEEQEALCKAVSALRAIEETYSSETGSTGEP